MPAFRGVRIRRRGRVRGVAVLALYPAFHSILIPVAVATLATAKGTREAVAAFPLPAPDGGLGETRDLNHGSCFN